MRIAIAGGHGQIALILSRRLTQQGHAVIGIIRNPEHAADVAATGAAAVVMDLEHADQAELAAELVGVDVLVFAAGAGPGSGVGRKYTVDQGASDLCAAAAQQAGVPRFLQISSMGTDHPPQDDQVFSHYLRAKAAAEQTVRGSGLGYVILRPGRLTDEAATGSVALGRHVARGAVPRADVAEVVADLVAHPGVTDRTLELTSGSVPVADAVAALAALAGGHDASPQ
jgi:uncharacterized protein YbjT (DUF2867 family)